MLRRTLPGGRTYLLQPGLALRPAPLVIGLHGTRLSAANCNDTFWVVGSPTASGWTKHALLNGYTLVLGEARGGTWNVGAGWPSSGQDDVRYLLDVVADVRRLQLGVDPRRVFVAGFSAGGALAWRAAATHPEVFAACGSASGWATVRPQQPIDCWHHHGTADATVPINGGKGINGYVFPPAVAEARTAPRGSRVVLYPTATGHSTPPWMADRLWQFWTGLGTRRVA